MCSQYLGITRGFECPTRGSATHSFCKVADGDERQRGKPQKDIPVEVKFCTSGGPWQNPGQPFVNVGTWRNDKESKSSRRQTLAGVHECDNVCRKRSTPVESNSSVWEPDLCKTTSHCLKLTVPVSLEHRQGTAFTFHLRGCDSLNFLLGILLIFLGNHRYKMLLLSANQFHEALLDFHFLQLKW